ncbi:MAG TPA: hypothetical protein VHX17_09550 [Candidatus Cybelea sp.]|nr:hypothetical protein [Candidatus Cybelea sp.]
MQLRRGPSPLAKIILGAGIFGILFSLSVIVQSFLGDTYLSSEGSIVQTAEQGWCGIASWSPGCGTDAHNGSTSTSTSLSTSVAR